MARVNSSTRLVPQIDKVFHRIGDIINNFRTLTLGIPALSFRNGPGIWDKLKVPWTYCMSPALVPKPDDWKNHIGLWCFINFLDGDS
jgi:hypothetical protein